MAARSQHQPSPGARTGPTAGTQVLIAVSVVVTVSLLTLLFSFLGTMTAGAVLGMVFGSMKHSKWRAGLISLVFPLVSLSCAEMPSVHENWTLAGICFGVFWMSYLLTGTAIYLEKKQATVPAAAPTDSSGTGQSGTPDTRAREFTPVSDPILNDLQGSWEKLPGVDHGWCGAETIEVDHDQFLVTVSGADGELQTICHGQVQVKQVGQFKVGAVVGTEGQEGVAPARFRSAPWLYKVVGEQLTIAWHFDEGAPGADPVVANYRKRHLATRIPGQKLIR